MQYISWSRFTRNCCSSRRLKQQHVQCFSGRCSSQNLIAGPDRFKHNFVKTGLETPKFSPKPYSNSGTETLKAGTTSATGEVIPPALTPICSLQCTQTLPVTKAANACRVSDEWNEYLGGSWPQMDGQDSKIIPFEISESPFLLNPSWPSFPRFNAGKFPRLCLHLIKFCPSALDLQASSTTERPNCRKIDMARLSRKNQGHHLGSSNMELVIEMQHSLKWELHPAKTIVSWNMRSFSHLHEKRAKFQQLKGHPNPFKTTRT